MFVQRVKVNNRYIRPKYGKGFFGRFTRLLSNTARKVAQSSRVKNALNSAISLGKVGTKVLKNVAKNPAVRQSINSLIETGAENAIDHIISKAKGKVDQYMPENEALRNISDTVLDQAGAKVKNIAKNKAKSLSDKILGGVDNATTTTGKRKNSSTKSVLIKKTTSKIHRAPPKKKQKVDFGDASLNHLINNPK